MINASSWFVNNASRSFNPYPVNDVYCVSNIFHSWLWCLLIKAKTQCRQWLLVDIKGYRSKSLLGSRISLRKRDSFQSVGIFPYEYNLAVYLGVCIDNTLNFLSYVSQILTRVYHITSTLSFIVRYFTFGVRIGVFITYILPHVNHAVPHFLSVKDRKRLKASLRYCANFFGLEFSALVGQGNKSALRDSERQTYKVHRDSNHPLHNELTITPK